MVVPMGLVAEESNVVEMMDISFAAVVAAVAPGIVAVGEGAWDDIAADPPAAAGVGPASKGFRMLDPRQVIPGLAVVEEAWAPSLAPDYPPYTRPRA